MSYIENEFDWLNRSIMKNPRENAEIFVRPKGFWATKLCYQQPLASS